MRGVIQGVRANEPPELPSGGIPQRAQTRQHPRNHQLDIQDLLNPLPWKSCSQFPPGYSIHLRASKYVNNPDTQVQSSSIDMT